MTSAVVKRLAHELDVIERAGLAEFFLICWDLMRFAKERGIPAQGRGSATSSIVSYTLGISRVEPIAHNLLFERFINEGRTTYPDVDIDFSLGAARGGHPVRLRPLRPRAHGDGLQPRHVPGALGRARGGLRARVPAAARGPGRQGARDVRLGHGPARPRGGRRVRRVLPAAGRGTAGRDRRRRTLPKALGFVDGMGQLNTRMPLVGKVPPWRQPPKPVDPNAPRPFAWLREGDRRAGAGMWEGAPESPPSIRPGGRHDDEGGPGDTPASVAWLRSGRGTGYKADTDRLVAPPLVDGRQVDPESGQLEPPPRATDEPWTPALTRWDPPATRSSSVARVEPEPPPQPRGGSTVGLSDWERWLEFCARIDGFPRHLSIHSGGMLVTAAPLIDIAPIERATMVDRVVVQFDKRDVETLKLIKLDLLGLGMLAAMDETLQLIEHDCAVCVDLDRLPEDVPEVFEMLQAADTVGVFQVESRAQMQTLPKSRPKSLDDLVVEVAIIRPGPIQGNAVHPFLRRKQGLEPVTYLHPSLEPVLKDSMGVILYQEQVMRIAIEVGGFTAAESDGFRRAMGTWRSSREMEKLHKRFFDGCMRQPGMTEEMAEELFRQVAAFASFGFAKSHAAAFARTAYESAFLKLFYPAQFLVGLINAQPMGFYPVEVLVNDAKRHGVAVLPVDVNASSYKTTTEWVGRPGEPLPDGAGIAARPEPIRSPACVVPSDASRDRWTPEVTAGWGVRLGLGLVKGIGEQHEALLDAELARGPYREPGRRGGADRACPRRCSSGSSGPGRWIRSGGRGASSCGSSARSPARHAVAWTGRRCAGWAGRPGNGPRRPAGRWTCGCPRPTRRRCPRSRNRSGSAMPTRSSGSMHGGRS